MLFDEHGNRLRPSHANNHGRRYRYYVSQQSSEECSENGTAWRLPAKEIETLVITAIADFLKDKLRLSRRLNLTGNCVETMLARAKQLAMELENAETAGQRSFLNEWVKRIEIRNDGVAVSLRTQALIQALGGDTKGHHRDDEVNLELPVALKRRGVETKLVLTDEAHEIRAPDLNLIAAVALGRKWFTDIRDGRAHSVSDIVKRDQVNQGDVSRMIPLGLLAPDIVDAILDGRQPIELTAVRLKRNGTLPLDWNEQRQRLGFA
jgi:hypothetical protein